jgi:competence protein ComEC
MLLPAWVAALAVGIGVAASCPTVVAWAALVLALVAAGWRLRRRRAATGVAALWLALGIVLGLRALPPPLAPVEATPPATRDVLARVVRGPDAEDAAGTRARLWLALERLDGRPASGTLALTVIGRPAGVAPGDLVSFRAALREPVGLANPGLPDARVAARAQGIDLVATLPAGESLTCLRRGWAASPRRIAWRLRAAMAAAIRARVPPGPAGFLLTVALGERAGVAEPVEDGFRAAGATHVLSVSGLHLASVAALIFFVVRRAAAAVPGLALRVGAGRVAAAVALPAVLLYTLLTGEAVATERSALMAAVALGAGLCGRSFALATSIAASALVLLLRSPLVLLDVSFQLSFASVTALGLFARRLAPQRAPPTKARWRRALGWLGRFGAATLAAGLATAPLVAHHFGEITPAAPLGNLALVPLVEVVILPLALGGALLGAAHPWLGFVPLTLAGRAAALALWLAEQFRGLAPVLTVRFPNWPETAALVLGSCAVLRGLSPGTTRRWWAVAAAALGVAAGSLAGRELIRRTSDQARITFLDVGQGDAAVVEGPGPFVAVVDGGGSYDDSFDTGARVVEPFLRARGIDRIDLVVLSHPHPDHLNGLFRVLSRFPVGAVWTSGDDGRNPRYRELLSLARRRGVARPPPAPWPAAVTLRPLGPWLGDRIGAPAGMGVNDASLVVRMEFAGRALLFPGDIEADGESELVGNGAAGAPVASDVLKVPHHGSRTSSSAELLDAVRPRLAVISLGRQNRFHFPRPEVLRRYHERGVTVLRTDESGAVTITIDRRGKMAVACARGCLAPDLR